MKGNGTSVNLVERAGDEKRLGAEEGGGICVWDVLYERKMNFKKKEKKMKEGIWGTERKEGKR